MKRLARRIAAGFAAVVIGTCVTAFGHPVDPAQAECDPSLAWTDKPQSVRVGLKYWVGGTTYGCNAGAPVSVMVTVVDSASTGAGRQPVNSMRVQTSIIGKFHQQMEAVEPTGGHYLSATYTDSTPFFIVQSDLTPTSGD
ncbi:MAG: hypothetical protein LBK95_06715 [Bifidobacteriaceae bacterium]|nr:hypothetical protein [Bifidobacteriaceae bacterium]